MPRYTQVKRLTDIEAFRAHVAGLGAEIPAVDTVASDGAHARPMTITDGSRGEVTVADESAAEAN